MSALLTSRIAQEFAQGVQPGAGQAAVLRQQAIEALAERGLPSSRDENWKYVNLRPLDKVRFAPVPAEPAVRVLAKELPPVIAGHAR